ncbi:MAG TPA: YdcF family protein [Candidatus Pacearchaeota archaeon]|nr:YdcF family protein [Candidatus Pacearchaeota archaeon]
MILQQIILPSVFIPIIILIGIVFVFSSKKYKLGRILLIIGLALYYIFSITPTVDLLLKPLEQEYSTVSDIQKADKIALLLGGRESDVLRSSEVLRIAHLTDHTTQIIISGTDSQNPNSGEALAVRNFFINRGVPKDNIIIEGNSRNTKENVKNIYDIVGDEHFFLVTSAYHMKRAMLEFEKLGANPIPAPIDFKSVGEYGILSYIPNSKNLRNSDLAMHEYFGIIFYNMKR